jgi:hypothetical protein
MKSILLTVLCSLLTHAQVNILTGNGNNDRTNANLQEIRLSPSTVAASTFGKVGIFPVDGQVYAQPLYVAGLSISDGQTHNVVFVSTMHNSVYAFDADAISPVSLLWQVNLGTSVPAPLLFGQYGDIAYEVGILGTGVIDLQRGVLYVVADTLEKGAPAFYLHALDLATGAEGSMVRFGLPRRCPGMAQEHSQTERSPWIHSSTSSALVSSSPVSRCTSPSVPMPTSIPITAGFCATTHRI